MPWLDAGFFAFARGVVWGGGEGGEQVPAARVAREAAEAYARDRHARAQEALRPFRRIFAAAANATVSFPQSSKKKKEKSPSLNVSRDLIRSRRVGGDGGAGGRRRGGGAGPVRGGFRRTEPGDRLRLLRVVQKVRVLFLPLLFSIEFC